MRLIEVKSINEILNQIEFIVQFGDSALDQADVMLEFNVENISDESVGFFQHKVTLGNAEIHFFENRGSYYAVNGWIRDNSGRIESLIARKLKC